MPACRQFVDQRPGIVRFPRCSVSIPVLPVSAAFLLAGRIRRQEHGRPNCEKKITKILQIYQIVYCVPFRTPLQSIVVMVNAEGVDVMNEHADDTLTLAWEESHPWLTLPENITEDEDSIGEVIRCTLDEMRFE